MSGVVFRVDQRRPHRALGADRLYFCCEACAAYFVAHRERVVAARDLSPSKKK